MQLSLPILGLLALFVAGCAATGGEQTAMDDYDVPEDRAAYNY